MGGGGGGFEQTRHMGGDIACQQRTLQVAMQQRVLYERFDGWTLAFDAAAGGVVGGADTAERCWY